MYGGTASHGNGEHGSRVGSASRRHGIASGRQCGHWNHRQAGIGEIETSGPELLVAAVSCARKASKPEESAVREQHLGTKALEKDKIDRHMKNLGCARFHQQSPGLTVEGCGRTTQYDVETRSTLPSISTTNPACVTESVSAHVYNQVHQKQNVCDSLSIPSESTGS